MKNHLLLAPKIESAGNQPERVLQPPPAEQTPEQINAALKKQLDEAHAQLAAAKDKLAKAGVVTDIEQDVIWRMRQGLTREEAITCARRQALYDQAWKDSKLEKDPAVAKAALDEGVKEALRTV